MNTLLPRPSESVVFKELEDGAVLFCTRTEVYFGVNAVGWLIWKSLPALKCFAELDTHIAAAFPDADPVERRGDAAEFLDALIELGLALPATVEAADARACSA